MVEVFKTNVIETSQALMLVSEIHKSFPLYKANFDLDDCDRILRVKSSSGYVNPFLIMVLLKDLGFESEPLPDTRQEEKWKSSKWHVIARETEN